MTIARDDMIAALERAERWCQWANALRAQNTQAGRDAAILRALADALREAENMTGADLAGDASDKYWLVPEPKVKP